MNARPVFAAVAVLAVLAGGLAWWATRVPREEALGPADISPGALYAAAFRDTRGAGHSLAEFQGNVLVVNFWATWCVPCREEIPGFVRLHERWKGRGVRFLGLSDDDPEKVDRFAAELRINYPLWVGSDSAGSLSRRLGNRLGVLPHTVILDPAGKVLDGRVGPYLERDLEAKLTAFVAK